MAWSVDRDVRHSTPKCLVSLTTERGLTTLLDTRSEAAKRLGHEDAITLGGVGGLNQLEELLHSMREWDGPKVRGKSTANQS